jgi:hypothetical protein
LFPSSRCPQKTKLDLHTNLPQRNRRSSRLNPPRSTVSGKPHMQAHDQGHRNAKERV